MYKYGKLVESTDSNEENTNNFASATFNPLNPSQHLICSTKTPSWVTAGFYLSEVNLLFNGAPVLELKALMVREHS